MGRPGEALLARLTVALYESFYAPREPLAIAGVPCRALGFVRKGRLVFSLWHGGHKAVVVGEEAVLKTPTEHPVSILAVRHAQVWWVGRDDLHRLAEECPPMGTAMRRAAVALAFRRAGRTVIEL
ncbi:unnamed protein product, partial [Phaeothamnion confervicola]